MQSRMKITPQRTNIEVHPNAYCLQEGWPEVVSKEVIQNLHRLLASVDVTIGNTEGKTLLPLPALDVPADMDEAVKDKDRVHILEACITTWTKEIKGVLKQEPDAKLNEGRNPGPLTELDFWAKKASDLNAIYDQLCSARVRKVVKILELSKSTYYPAFSRLCNEVANARVQANSNVKHLKPLRKHFERIGKGSDVIGLVSHFKPVWHLLLLIWKHSPYYNTASRFVVLVREICNGIITEAHRYLSGSGILEMESNDASERLRKSIQVCNAFKHRYSIYKQRASEECPDNPWKFQNNALFGRLEAFLERCYDVLDLVQTMQQFEKLEKIELGGTRGKTLTNSIRQIHTDFQQAVEKFQNLDYDIMDIDKRQFDDDFYEFRSVIKDLERRLASIITQAFDDCSTVTDSFKLLDSFEGLLERELIQAEFEKKHIELVRAFGDELRTVQQLFSSQKNNPSISKNAPPHSGAVKWVMGLMDRIDEPMKKISGLSEVVMQTEEAQEVQRLYESLRKTLVEYKEEKYNSWCRLVENHSEEKLKQNLLTKEQHGDQTLVRVNFDPELVMLLREVKYFFQLGVEVPEQAKKLFKRSETLRQQTSNLELIVRIYNNVLTTMLDVEHALVAQKVENAEHAFSKGLSSLTWNSHKIDDYIQVKIEWSKCLHNA